MPTISLSGVLLSAQDSGSLEIGRSRNGSLEAVLTKLSLQVNGATPGGEVAYLGANLVEHHESWGSLDTYSGILTDSDANGQVELAPKGGISGASVWIVVDLTSGDLVDATPTSFTKHLPEEMDLEVSSGGDGLSVDRSDLEFLLYRPGTGVWFGKAVDRGPGDTSVPGGAKLQLNLSAFSALRQSDPAAPVRLRSGDRLLAIDLHHLDSASVTFQ